MRIVHVVTYVSQDGAFGGPIAVAVAQLTELARQGHDVELIAGWDGVGALEVPGVKVSLFKARKIVPGGFSGLWAPQLIRALRSRAKAGAVIHVHMARDIVTLGSAFALKRSPRVILQTHGMVMPDDRPFARLLDKLVTRPVLSGARCVFVLTTAEESGVRLVAGERVSTKFIANGLATVPELTAKSGGEEVLFLSRLHPRKRVIHFARMSEILIQRGVACKFVVVGPDEGDLPELLAFANDRSLGKMLSYAGPLATGQAVQRLAAASVYVLPSVGEVFPMTILESLAARTPVVTTSDSGLAPLLSELGAALITDGSPEGLADAVELILENEEVRRSLVTNGTRALETTFSIEAVADVLLGVYSDSSQR